MASQTYESFTLTPLDPSSYALRLTISSPPINLIGHTLLTDLHAFLTSLSQPSPPSSSSGASSSWPPKIVTIASANPSFWISHLDLHVASAKYPLPPPHDPHKALHLLGEVFRLFATLPTIFVAEINGRTAGGGNEFALSMDMRFAGPDARFVIPEVAGGLTHVGGLQSLTRLIGAGRAAEYMLSAGAVGAEEAERVGWVNRRFESAEGMRAYVDGLVVRVAGWPRGGIEATKRGVRENVEGTGSVGKDMERFQGLVGTEEVQWAVGRIIELSEDFKAGSFELELAERLPEVWEGYGESKKEKQ